MPAACDMAVVASSKAELQHLMGNINQVTQDCQMKINIKHKTKLATLFTKRNRKLDNVNNNQLVENVSQFSHV